MTRDHNVTTTFRWVEQGERYEEDRTEHLPELLTLVRLPLLSTVYLVDRVGSSPSSLRRIPC